MVLVHVCNVVGAYKDERQKQWNQVLVSVMVDLEDGDSESGVLEKNIISSVQYGVPCTEDIATRKRRVR